MTKSSHHKLPKDEMQNLFELGDEMRKHSYCEYSGFRVGAAVRADSGKIYTGCNIENSSYGATMCAERVAIYKAVANGDRKITDVVVVTDSDDGWPPCGLCRQVLSEFADKDCVVHIANTKGVQKSLRFNDLMPMAFTPDHIHGKR